MLTEVETAKIAIPLGLVLIGNILQLRSGICSTVLRVLGFFSLGLNIGKIDLFSDMLIISSIIIGTVIAMYTPHYSHLKYGNLGLVMPVDIFLLSMTLVFASEYLIELITFWLLTELLGFLLIAYDYIAKKEEQAMSAAVKYLVFSMIPTDVALFILLAITGFAEAFNTPLRSIAPRLADPVVLTMIILGFFSKAAIFPLHFWLPDAHSVAPSPASALLSGLMVKMGVFAIYLLSHYPINRDLAASITLFSGFLTTIYGALQASTQCDVKRLLAYSTTSNTALIAVLMALYLVSSDRVFIEAAMLYTAAHAVYKASMFMDSGFIELLTGERDVRRLGYIGQISPLESMAALLSVLAILGIPPSMGFLAKVFTFASISRYITISWIYLAALIVASIKVSLSIIYNIVYLRSHFSVRGTIQASNINRGALILQPYTFIASLLSLILVLALYILDCSGYIELELFKKLTSFLASSLILFAFLGLSLYKFFKSIAIEGWRQ